MWSSSFGPLRGWSALFVLAALTGCEPPSIDPAEDAGVEPTDGASPLPDAEAPPPPPPPPPGECATHTDCADDDPCTDTFCEDGACWASRVEGCFSCATDADCDDSFACSIETCVGGACSFEWSPECECLEGPDCDDGDPSTTDRCTSAFRCEHEARTCATDAECDDANVCTTDTCAAATCTSSPIFGCGTTCPDRDGDGHGTRFCFGGDDCDDANPALHPGATEACDNGVDDDCDGRVDLIDEACSLGGETCETARTIVSGVALEGAVVSTGPGGVSGGCGTSAYHALTLTEPSDVEITITLEEPPPPTPVPGCPECTAEHAWEYWFNVYLESTCGDVTSDAGGMGGGCRIFGSDRFFGGSNTLTRLVRRVPAGAYTVDVQANDWRGWMASAIRFTVTVAVTPADAPACSTASVLADGTPITGRTGSGTDAFATDCRGAALVAEEALHTFTLPGRRRVRLEAVGVVDPASGVAPGLRLGVHQGCDPAAARVDCLEHTGRECHERATLERVLDAGTYWVVVEGTAGGDHGYSLTLGIESANASCRSAPSIAGSGSFMGDTTSATDAFRDRDICGDGYGPDAVYRVEVATESRVVLDLVASYTDPLLTLYRGCGEELIAGGRGRTRVDTTLTAGTYYAVVGGAYEASAGSYVLNSTFVPTP